MIKFFVKAKALPVGTHKKRKSGTWVKDAPHHWALLKELVNKKQDAAGKSRRSESTKIAHEVSSKLARHLKNHDSPFDKKVANEFLERKFGKKYGDRDGWTPFKHDVVHATHQYLSALEGKKVDAKVDRQIEGWRDRLQQVLSVDGTATQNDHWLNMQFKKHGHNMGDVFNQCRSAIGINTPTIPPPAGKGAGFRGFCTAILRKGYMNGPGAFGKEEVERITKAFHKAKAGPRDHKLVSESEAMHLLKINAAYSAHPNVFKYCVKRMAGMNNGVVSLAGLRRYFENALNKYGDNPPAVGRGGQKVAKKPKTKARAIVKKVPKRRMAHG